MCKIAIALAVAVMFAGCCAQMSTAPRSQRSAPLEVTPSPSAPSAKQVAGSGDLQLTRLPPNFGSAAVAFVTERIPARGGTAEASICTYFSTTFIGRDYSEARPAPKEVLGKTFRTGDVLVELRDAEGAGSLWESKAPVTVSPSEPTVLSLQDMRPVPDAAGRRSLWGTGTVGEARPPR